MNFLKKVIMAYSKKNNLDVVCINRFLLLFRGIVIGQILLIMIVVGKTTFNSTDVKRIKMCEKWNRIS